MVGARLDPHRHHGVVRATPFGLLGTDETESNREAMRRAFEAWRNGTGAIADAFDSISFNNLWSRIQP